MILPTDLGYLALALHVESLQSSFIGSDQRVWSMSRRHTEEQVKLVFRIPGSSSVTRRTPIDGYYVSGVRLQNSQIQSVIRATAY